MTVQLARQRLMPLTALLGVALAAIAFPGIASGNNWGALDPNHRCTTDVGSQCTANNGLHNVWFGGLRSDLETAAQNSINDDYNFGHITTQRVTTVNDNDAQLFDDDYGNTTWYAYDTCASFATYGGTGATSWCRPHLTFFNDGFWTSKYDQWQERAHIMCHELGHTLGLRHYNDPLVQPPSPSQTCVRDGALTLNLTQHDRDELNAHY